MTNGNIPGYIPPHLQGKVDSFRNEPDGKISFRHDAAALGGFGDAGGRKTISPEQYKQTFDPSYRLTHLNDAVTNQYGLDRFPTNSAQQFNNWVGGKLREGLEWGTSTKGRSAGTAGLLAAIAGGIGGTVLARRADSEHPYRNGVLSAILAGALGTGTSALLQARGDARENYLNKTAGISEETAYLRSVILGDSKMSPTEKAEVLRALGKMQDKDRDELADRARSLFGFGAGMYIARALFSKGLIPSIIGGILGASAMSSSFKNHKPKTNPWGQFST